MKDEKTDFAMKHILDVKQNGLARDVNYNHISVLCLFYLYSKYYLHHDGSTY